MRCWATKTNAKAAENSIAASIRQKLPSFEADFNLNELAVVDRTVPRFVPNPANWGPGSRAGNQK